MQIKCTVDSAKKKTMKLNEIDGIDYFLSMKWVVMHNICMYTCL